MTTAAIASKSPRKSVDGRRAWAEMRALMAQHRQSLTIGFSLMLVNRVAGLVLPASSKYLIDTVIVGQQYHLLVPLALAALGASVIQAGSGFALSQLLGVAAQRAVTDMRRQVEAHVLRLPIRQFVPPSAAGLTHSLPPPRAANSHSASVGRRLPAHCA